MRELPFLGLNAVVIDDSGKDDNGRIRVRARLSRLLPGVQLVGTIGVDNDVEVALNILDILDAVASPWLPDQPKVNEITHLVIANIARRTGSNNHCVTFGYVRFRNVLIITTLSGHELSLLKKLWLKEGVIRSLDISEVIRWAFTEQLIGCEFGGHINKSQFRTFDFVPLLALWLLSGKDKELPSTYLSWENVPDLDSCFAWVDRYGNSKTTIPARPWLKLALDHPTLGKERFLCNPTLASVPDNEVGVTRGSSGYWGIRLAEVVKKGGSAADLYDLTTGLDSKVKIGEAR